MASTQTPTRAIIYTRQSLDRDATELAVSRQREDAENLARLRGWSVVRVLTDNDTTASGKKTRPGFDALLTALEAGEATVVVAWALDRLTRNRRDQLRLIETCERHGVTIALVRGSDIDMSTPAGRLVADILSATARAEIDVKGERQKRAILQAAKEGRWVSGRKPFGYADDGVTIIPEEAKAVQDGYDMFLSGVPLGEIAREWNRRGFFAQSRDWDWGSVRAVLKNPRYAGLRAYRKEIMGPAEWERLVPEETWRAAVDMFAGRAAVTAPRGAKRLLTGLARCGACDATLHAGGAYGGYPMYRCSAYTKATGGKAPASAAPHVSRKALPVEAYVVGLVLERLSQPDAAELLMDRDRPDTDALRQEATAKRVRLESLLEDYVDGTLTKEEFRTAKDRLTNRIAEIEGLMADAGRVDVLGPLITAEDKWAVWEEMGHGRQRAVIDTLMVVRVDSPGRGTRTFRPDTVRIEWK